MLALLYPYDNMIAFWTISLSRHHTLLNIFDKAPHVHKVAFVAPSLVLLKLGKELQYGMAVYGCASRGLCFVS
jgi:gamma-carbonic anhydrase